MARSVIYKIARDTAAVLAIVLCGAWYGCGRQTVPGTEMIEETLAHRAFTDSLFRFSPQSPFLQDTSVHYHGLNYYPPDSTYCFASALHRYAVPAPVTIYGTKGEPRPMLRYGYFIISYGGKDYPLNVYKNAPADGRTPADEQTLSVWFTDETTGRETYNVGRYLDVGDEDNDPHHTYFLNFNDAYNPYCAYTPMYSCAVPMKEDHLPFAVRAGEKKYHP